MNLIVTRDTKTTFSTIGKMAVNGEFLYYTLEPPTRSDDVKPRAIPCGTYDVKMIWSHKFQRIMPHVVNVPGFEAIEIHWGNFPDDTQACTLVGYTKGPMPDFIGDSKRAFGDLFLAMVEEKDPITISYLEAENV